MTFGRSAQGMQPLFPVWCQLARTLEQSLLAIGLDGREGRSAGQGMGGVGVAVKQLDRLVGAGAVAMHDRIVDVLPGHHRTHRHRARGQTPWRW